MKIIYLCVGLLLLSSVLAVKVNSLTESTCQVEYISFPIEADSSYVMASSQPQVFSTYVSPTPVQVVTTSTPFVVYTARLGDKSWRVSVMDQKLEKDYKAKGEEYLSEKGDKWYVNDKVDKNDENFKKAFARCQSYNWTMKSRKTPYRTKELENKVVNEIPEFFEKINKKVEEKPKAEEKKVEKKLEEKSKVDEKKVEKKVEEKPRVEEKKVVMKVEEKPKVEEKKAEKKVEEKPKVEEKKVASPTSFNASNSPIGVNSAEKQRFIQKQDDLDMLNDDSDLEKFTAGDKADVSKIKAKKADKPKIAKSDKNKDTGTKKDKKEKDKKDKKADKKLPDVASVPDDEQDDFTSAPKKKEGEDENENKVLEKSGKESSIEDDHKLNELSADNQDSSDSIAEDDNNELSDDEKVIETKEETEKMMDMEEDHDQEEMEENLKHDLNPYNENNPDLL